MPHMGRISLPLVCDYHVLMVNSPGEVRNGGCSRPEIISSTSKNGFSPNTSVYSVTPRDHISSSGPE